MREPFFDGPPGDLPHFHEDPAEGCGCLIIIAGCLLFWLILVLLLWWYWG